MNAFSTETRQHLLFGKYKVNSLILSRNIHRIFTLHKRHLHEKNPESDFTHNFLH